MRQAWRALAIYVAVSLAATWPLAPGLAQDVAWDLGDSLLNMWILAWDCEQLLAILGGNVARLATFFDANVFHPSPLALAYSEHLVPQAVQILPVYALTGNPILCYNLLFLSTFVLSGLGMFLLVRELTRNSTAAFIAGLLFAFAPYRLAQSSHLQVLSSQWMPFALYGFVRYFDTRRLRPLVGGAAALVLQNLSSGYYLLFFSPFVALFVLWEVARRNLWRDARLWCHLGSAAVFVAMLTLPLTLPYIVFQAQGFARRSAAEVSLFSADVYSYLTAFSEQRIWGDVLRVFPKQEGDLFPGAVPILLAAIAVVWRRRQENPPLGSGDVQSTEPRRPVARWLSFKAPPWLLQVLVALVVLHLAATAVGVVLRRFTIEAGPLVIRVTNIDQMIVRAGIAFAALLILSPEARRRTVAFFDRRGCFLVAMLAAAWLSLGPTPQSLGRPLELFSPYQWLAEHAPGFSGARVPARFAMVAVLMGSILAGYGADVLSHVRSGKIVLAILALLFMVEATRQPFLVNGMFALRDFNAPEGRIYPPRRAPAIYRELAQQPADAVLVELPLGPPDFDLRAMYYSTVHWRRLVNGYSGFFPPYYGRLTAALSEIPRHPDASVEAIRASGVTHVIVHEGAYRGTEGLATIDILRAAGAAEIFRDGSDVLLAFAP